MIVELVSIDTAHIQYIQKQYNLRVKSQDLVEKASLWNFSHKQLHDDNQLLHHVGEAECIPLRRQISGQVRLGMGKLQACMNDRTFITSSFLACTYVCVYVYMQVCAYVYVYVYAYVYADVCAHVYVCVCIYVAVSTAEQQD